MRRDSEPAVTASRAMVDKTCFAQDLGGLSPAPAPGRRDGYVGALMSPPEAPLDQLGHTARKDRRVQLAAVAALVAAIGII